MGVGINSNFESFQADSCCEAAFQFVYFCYELNPHGPHRDTVTAHQKLCGYLRLRLRNIVFIYF
jgi:hypothetical protein